MHFPWGGRSRTGASIFQAVERLQKQIDSRRADACSLGENTCYDPHRAMRYGSMRLHKKNSPSLQMGCELLLRRESDYCGGVGAGAEGVIGLFAGGVVGGVGVVCRSTRGVFCVTVCPARSVGQKVMPSARMAATIMPPMTMLVVEGVWRHVGRSGRPPGGQPARG